MAKSSSNLAPIALFVYARPDHTRKTLEALSRNRLAGQSRLYVYSDAPRDKSKAKAVAEVRQLIRSKPWCSEVEIIESATNRGLADSIRTGVSEVSAKHGRVIVLEDDLVTSPGFLEYMNAGLDTYASDERVYQVSGFMARPNAELEETGFLRVSTSWGWATWQRAWQHYDNDAQELLGAIGEANKDKFDLDRHGFYYQELERNAKGELKTWHVRWYASLFLKNALCLYPSQSLVKNLGFDDSGENCNAANDKLFRKIPFGESINVERKTIEESPQYLSSLQQHYDELIAIWTRPSLRNRITGKIRKMISGK